MLALLLIPVLVDGKLEESTIEEETSLEYLLEIWHVLQASFCQFLLLCYPSINILSSLDSYSGVLPTYLSKIISYRDGRNI